jgi:hexosaminidase
LPKKLICASDYPWPFECTIYSCEEFKPAARALCDAIQKNYGVYARMVQQSEPYCREGNMEGPRIVFRQDEMAEEAYRVEVHRGAATLSAATLTGAAHAASMFFQLIEVDGARVTVPDCLVEDAPDTAWRGVMLDLARKYLPLQAVLRTVDLCWLTRCNRLHLHFTDNEAYRLPSEAFPKLPHADAYTKEELRYLTQYAAARGVMVVPEIEMPGHAQALTAAYPECFGSNASAVCAGHSGLFEQMETLLREVAALFPDSPYLHIGGDEVDVRLWITCEECAAYMEKEGIEDVYTLYAHCIERFTKTVLAIGKTPIVWEGFPAKGGENIPRETIVMAFESLYQTAPELLEAGFRIINASWMPLYVVPAGLHHPSANPAAVYAWNTYRWDNWWTRSRAWPDGIEIEPTDRVLGAQVCMWEANDMLSRKPVREALFALAERLWNLERRMEFDAFWQKASSAMARYAALVG